MAQVITLAGKGDKAGIRSDGWTSGTKSTDRTDNKWPLRQSKEASEEEYVLNVSFRSIERQTPTPCIFIYFILGSTPEPQNGRVIIDSLSGLTVGAA